MDLTPKQDAFCHAVADGNTQADAYRLSYNAEKMAAKTIQENASRLMSDSKISARVKELKEKLEEQKLWSRIDSVKILAGIARNEDDEARPADRVNAVKALNAMHGWDKQVIDHQSSDGSMKPVSKISIEVLDAAQDSGD